MNTYCYDTWTSGDRDGSGPDLFSLVVLLALVLLLNGVI